MKKEIILCDGCGLDLKDITIPVHFIDHHFCEKCIKQMVIFFLKSRTKPLRTRCNTCHGKGTYSVIDEKETIAQASCGENRTQYKTIPCGYCKLI